MTTRSPIRGEALVEPCSAGACARVRHILLITRSFPPLNVVSSQRMHQWVKYWSRDGVRVTVLTTKKHWLFGPCDLDCPPLPNVKVVEVEFLPALLVRLLERWQPTRAVATATGGEAKLRPGSSRLVRIKTWMRRWRLSTRLLPRFEFYDLWVRKAVQAGAEIVAGDPVDVLVSSYSPPAAHKIGARLKRRFPNVSWVADYRDVWTFEDSFPLRSLAGYIERRRERASVGRYADLLVHLCSYRAEQSRRFTAQPVIVVENGFDPEERVGPARSPETIPEPVRAAWAPVTLVYTGVLQLDYQDPTPLFRAIRSLVSERDEPGDNLRVLFFGDRSTGLQRVIEAEGVEQQVRIVGYVDRPTALWAQRNASALLLVEDEESAARGLLRAKMYEYLQAEQPILGIGFSVDTEVGRILVDTGVGVVCGVDVGCIRNHLRNLQLHGEIEGFAPVPEVLQRFRRDVQARHLLATMEALLTEERRTHQSLA